MLAVSWQEPPLQATTGFGVALLEAKKSRRLSWVDTSEPLVGAAHKSNACLGVFQLFHCPVPWGHTQYPSNQRPHFMAFHHRVNTALLREKFGGHHLRRETTPLAGQFHHAVAGKRQRRLFLGNNKVGDGSVT